MKKFKVSGTYVEETSFEVEVEAETEDLARDIVENEEVEIEGNGDEWFEKIIVEEITEVKG